MKLRSGKNFLERAVQHLYPLELSSDSVVCAPSRVLNADALVFQPRRQAALWAEERIHQIAEAKDSDIEDFNLILTLNHELNARCTGFY